MNRERIMQVLLSPRLTEKTARIGDKHNQVSFKVTKDATKREIKQAVELLYNVTVNAVNVCNVKAKSTRRIGGVAGKRKGWKKAYISLAEGNDIDFTAVE